MNVTYVFFCLLIGLLLITIIDTLGAISSRKLNFNYAYLSIFSLGIYTGTGYLLSKKYDLPIALVIAGLLGLYDGTIGLRLSIILKANNGLGTDKTMKLLNMKTAVMMLLIACTFTFIGYQLRRFL